MLSRDAHHQSQGEDRGTQGRQGACPAQPEPRDTCACAPGLLGGAQLIDAGDDGLDLGELAGGLGEGVAVDALVEEMTQLLGAGDDAV